MLFIDGGFGLVMLALWLFCIVDVITTDESRIRNLPKLVWLMIVIVLPDVGSIAWLIAGHTWDQRQPLTRLQTEYPEYDRLGRHVSVNPDDDEAFFRQLRARAEEQRRRAKQQQRDAMEPPDQV